jgi:hypothetical protein
VLVQVRHEPHSVVAQPLGEGVPIWSGPGTCRIRSVLAWSSSSVFWPGPGVFCEIARYAERDDLYAPVPPRITDRLARRVGRHPRY